MFDHTFDEQEQQVRSLLLRYKSGDQSAYDPLEAIYHNLIAKTAYKLRGERKEVDLEDLIQEGRIALLDAIGRFDLERGVKFVTFLRYRLWAGIEAYLRANVPNVVLVSLDAPIEDDLILADAIPDQAMPTEEQAVRSDVSDELLSRLAVLSARQRAIVCLTYGLLDGEEHTVREIARVLGLGKSQVANELNESLALLRATYDKREAGQTVYGQPVLFDEAA